MQSHPTYDRLLRILGQVLWPLIVLGSGVLLFSLTFSDAIQAADSGELVSAACGSGVAHPPGYPLYTLLGSALCRLPWSTAAARVGLLSAASGVLTLLLVYAIVLILTGNRWASTVAALTLATGTLFWRYASLSEVFALNTALCMGVVAGSLLTAQARSAPGRLLGSLACGLLCGLSLSNHHSAVFVAPAALLTALLPPFSPVRLLSRLGCLSLGGALGLTPYLSLLFSDPLAAPRWGDTSTWSGLVHHVLRRDYGTLTLSIGGRGSAGEVLRHFAALIPDQLTWVLWPVALLGMLLLLARASAEPGEEQEAGIPLAMNRLLGLLPLLCGPVFFALFNLGSAGTEGQVVERFFLLPCALLCVTLGQGLAWLDTLFLQRPAYGRTAALWRAGALALVAVTALHSYPDADVSESYAVEDYARNALTSAERGALILGAGDVITFSMLHAQRVRGLRRDVQYVDVNLLLYPWYVAQKRRERPGFTYRFQPGNVDTLGLIRGKLDRGVPVYLATVYNDKVLRNFAGYPAGPLIRLLSPWRLSPPHTSVIAFNEALFARFVRRGRPPSPERDPWSAQLMEPFARTWQSIARAALSAGDRPAALRALARAQQWAPWMQLLTN